MKKITIAILIFISISSSVGHAGFFKGNSESGSRQETTGNYGGFFNSSPGSSRETSPEYYGGFFRNDEEWFDRPRPGDTGGIGQIAPLGDGLYVLIACCVALVIAKSYGKRRKK